MRDGGKRLVRERMRSAEVTDIHHDNSSDSGDSSDLGDSGAFTRVLPVEESGE